MSDWKGAWGKAGVQASPQPKQPGRPAGPPPQRQDSGADPFPPGYPKYFGPDGFTRPELLIREAETLARRFEDEKLTRHQLRAFYGHAKLQLQRVQNGVPFGSVQPELAKLKYMAADRASRSSNRLPATFKSFIDRNIAAVQSQRDFEKGFMPHFEAVVAYCGQLRD